jgi:3-oxoacyl-[acyl-carrier protein] reductase
LVTGSTGGIGAAIAREFAAAGANIILHGHRHRDNAEKLAAELRSFSVSVEILTCELADEQARHTLIDKAWAIAPISVLVNTAGVDVLTGTAASWSFEQKLAALWQVDVEATIHLSRACGQRMRDRGNGTIINIGWSQAETGMAGESGEYFATVKGAVAAFTKSLAKSLAPHVRVNCVAPGWIQTKWGDTASSYWQNRAQSESLLNRWGQSTDVARVVRFLASEDAAFINGQVIPVDGGFAGSADDRHWS